MIGEFISLSLITLFLCHRWFHNQSYLVEFIGMTDDPDPHHECMICQINTTHDRRLSHYNKTTTVCGLCGTIESALKCLNENIILRSPDSHLKIMFSQWKAIVLETRNEISAHAGLSYIRKGVVIYPLPNRDNIIKWLSHKDPKRSWKWDDEKGLVWTPTPSKKASDLIKSDYYRKYRDINKDDIWDPTRDNHKSAWDK